MNDERAPESEERSWLDRLTHFISGEPQNKSDLEGVLSLAQEHEIIDEDARKIMEGALSVSDMQVRDIMIPRAQMVVIDSDQSLQEALPKILQSGRSRYPVIGEGIDDVIGILLAKDLLPLIQADRDVPSISTLMRPVTAVPESKRLNVLLREFRQNRNHMAIVIDEYGGIAGLITIEDVLEEIVGEIEDETDVDEGQLIRPINDDSFLVEALTPIEDFNEYFGTGFSDEEFDTIGGLVINAFGQLPTRNQTIRLDQFEFKVIHADERRADASARDPRHHRIKGVIRSNAPRWGLAFAAGCVFALGLAPYNLWPAIPLSAGLLFTLLRDSPSATPWRTGLAYGLGFFGVGVSWSMSASMYGPTPAAVAILLTAVFCGGLALLHGFQASLFYLLGSRHLSWRLIQFASIWVLFEWLQADFPDGLSWAYAGYSALDSLLHGWIPVIGIYGCSWLVVSLAAPG